MKGKSEISNPNSKRAKRGKRKKAGPWPLVAPRSYNWGVKLLADKKKRLAQYRKTVEALEQVRARELANMTNEDALRKIESLQCAGEPWRARPDWSGLIELQAIFHRRKKKRRQG